VQPYKDDTTDNKRTEKRQKKCQSVVKSKELQANTQTNAFAPHLILPNLKGSYDFQIKDCVNFFDNLKWSGKIFT